MAAVLIAVVLLILALVKVVNDILYPLIFAPLSHVPGPKLFGLTKWRLAYEDWTGQRTRAIHRLHERYGPAVRIGPNEVHFNSLSALKAIYGAGSGFERTVFYRRFDAYGRQNLFTFARTKEHGERKRLLANGYAKSTMMRGPVAELVEGKVLEYLKLIKEQPINEIFTSLHYYSLDNITNFLYGPSYGGTRTLQGNLEHRALLDDIFHHARTTYTWFSSHLPTITKWMYSRTGLMERLVKPLLPMQKPTTYTAIRAHALKAMLDFSRASADEKAAEVHQYSIIAKLWEKHVDRVGAGGLEDLDIASECADHFLAGIDTTSDTLVFVFWALSRPEHLRYQEKLIEEVRNVPIADLTDAGLLTLEAADKLPYLDAVIKESLRLYAPLPTSEPRSYPTDITVDGYMIPAGTVVNCSPWSLHRNPDVFPDPQRFNPERWLTANAAELSEMRKWYWPFSSGGRMCIGIHLALAEIVALVSAVYREFDGTRIMEGKENVSPGITSRHEIFGDELCDKVEEHTCWIQFVSKEKG